MYEYYLKEIEKIKSQIIDKFNPSKIIVFGSVAKGVIHKGSDIDLCIVMDYNNKREILEKLYLEVDTDLPVDFVLYTNDEWEKYKNDTTTFASIIHKSGRIIYG